MSGGAALGYLALGGSVASPAALLSFTALGQVVLLALGYLFVTRRLLSSARCTSGRALSPFRRWFTA